MSWADSRWLMAVLAVFGAPLEHPDASSAALAAARELRAELVVVLGGTGFGIGVSAGRAFSGEIGAKTVSNIRSSATR